MDRFYDELEAHVPVFKCETIDEAIKQAYVSAKQEMCTDPVILLSPACASFDQFSSYEHRGDVFASFCRDIQDGV